MKLEIPIIVGFDDMESLLDDLKKLQTYKLSEGDEMVLVDIEDVADVLVKHIKAKEKQPDACENTCEIERKSNDLIYKQDAIDALIKWYGCEPSDIGAFENIIEKLPSAQPDIIRCKDCKYYGRTDKRRFYRGMDCLNKHIATIVPDRDFCSYAERRTDE